jgi:hypothetical protein
MRKDMIKKSLSPGAPLVGSLRDLGGHPSRDRLERKANKVLAGARMISLGQLPERLEDLLSLERRLEREWWWVNGVDRMRVAIAARLAQLACPADPGPRS